MMSTLKFSYKPSPKGRIRIYELHQTEDRAAPKGSILSIQDATLIHHGNSDVFRATMRHSVDDAPIDVVVNIKYEDFARIRREARIYKRLVTCQGETIPRCYGLFQGLFSGQKAVCLVLEDCAGNGVEHTDLEERNIVVHPDGRPRIIDFDEATLYDCGAQADITIHAYEPTPGEVGCGEMLDVGCMMFLWRPRTIRYFGRNVDVRWAKSPEILATQAPKDAIPWDAEARAREAIAAYDKLMQWRKSLPQ